VDKLNDEGRIELPSEEQMCLILGLKVKDKIEEQERKTRCGVVLLVLGMVVSMVHVPFRYFSTYRGRE
jgi:hypothetical protein